MALFSAWPCHKPRRSSVAHLNQSTTRCENCHLHLASSDVRRNPLISSGCIVGAQIIESNVNLTQIKQFVGGSLIIAGTEHGALRAYLYPLTGMILHLEDFPPDSFSLCT